MSNPNIFSSFPAMNTEPTLENVIANQKLMASILKDICGTMSAMDSNLFKINERLTTISDFMDYIDDDLEDICDSSAGRPMFKDCHIGNVFVNNNDEVVGGETYYKGDNGCCDCESCDDEDYEDDDDYCGFDHADPEAAALALREMMHQCGCMGCDSICDENCPTDGCCDNDELDMADEPATEE